MQHETRSRWTSLAALIGFAAVVVGASAVVAGLFGSAYVTQLAIEAESPRVAVLDRQLERARAMALEGPSNEQAKKLFLPESTVGLAAARLQGMLVRQAEKNGGQVSSAQVLTTEVGKDPSLERVAVGLTMAMPLSGLRDYLLAVEGNAPLVFIDEINVAPARSVGGNMNEALSVSIKASGYLQRRRDQ